MKNKVVIFGILLFLVVITIGYALLSGNINVTSTANINPIDMDLEYEYGVIPYGEGSFIIDTTETGHSNESITCSGTTCTYSVDFSMPGAVQDFYIQITNNSSFDVRLKRVIVNSSYTGNPATSNDGVFMVYSTGIDNLIAGNLTQYALRGGIFSSSMPSLEITDEEICNGHNECYIRDNGGVYTIVIAEMPQETEGSNTLNYSVTRTMTFEFEQYNRY